MTIAHTAEEEVPAPLSEQRQVQQVPLPPVDYDSDDDGLINVSRWLQLQAMKYDLNEDEKADKEEFADAYARAFPGTIANMGFPSTVSIRGYELVGDLDFESNPASWQSIGEVFAKPYQAVLEGNGLLGFCFKTRARQRGLREN